MAKRRSLAQARADAEAALSGEKPTAPKRRRAPQHIEDQHQAALFKWVELAKLQDPRLALLHAIPNGGKRTQKINSSGERYSPEAARMKAQGVRAGVPDLDLPVPWTEECKTADGHTVPVAGYIGLRIELKRPIVPGQEKPLLSPSQKWWCETLQGVGHCVCVCYGWEEARESILYYLAGASVPHQFQAKP